ncbi:MAG: hypothetical protein K2X61_02565 [Caulobacteraceae bacterium]|nr:hypothetical protein [Caulobacteraceae bacterium]
MNDPIAAAKARLAQIEEEAEKLRLFIAAYESVADYIGIKVHESQLEPNPVDKSASGQLEGERRRTRAVNPPTDKVVENAILILRQRGHPMSRRALHDALWQRGIEVRGTDPVKTLGTILWRARDKLIQLEGYGYWPKEMSYGRANYLRPQETPKAEDPLDDLLG